MRDLDDLSVCMELASLSFETVKLQGKLFIQGAAATDVVQGSRLGTCWLLAAMAAVADARPDIIKRSFKSNRDASCNVKLYWPVAGGVKYRPGTVIPLPGSLSPVEERVELSASRNAAYHSHSRQKRELWVTILEKTVAQRSGGYKNIATGGVASVALQYLTGDSRKLNIDHAKPEAIWKALVDNTAHHYPMVAPSKGEEALSSAGGQDSGVVPDHTYALLAARQNPSGERRVFLYNPWGGKGTRGAFSVTFDEFLRCFKTVRYAIPKQQLS